MKAEELQTKSADLCSKLRRTPMPISEVIPHIQKLTDEMLRLNLVLEKLRANTELDGFAYWLPEICLKEHSGDPNTEEPTAEEFYEAILKDKS